MDGKKNPLGAALGLLFLGVFFLGGCAGISVREVSVHQVYPAAAKPPMEVVVAPGPGFVEFATIKATFNTKAGYQEVRDALVEKAQALGAQLISIQSTDYSTSYYKHSFTNPVAGKPGWVQTDTWEGYGTEGSRLAYLTVYDPDLSRKVKIQLASAEIGAMEKNEEGYPSLKDPKTFTRPENQARWTTALEDLKRDFQEGRYPAALSAAKALQSRVDGCKRTGGGGSNGNPDQDDWIADCRTQWRYYHALDRTLAYFQKLIELQSHKKTDPETALREYQAQVNKWLKKKVAEDEAKGREQLKKRHILRDKLSKLEVVLKSYDKSQPGWGDFWGFQILVKDGLDTGNSEQMNHGFYYIENTYRYCWQYNEEKRLYNVTKECADMKAIIEHMVDIYAYYRTNEKDFFFLWSPEK